MFSITQSDGFMKILKEERTKKRMDTNLKEKAKKISNFVYNNYGEILAGAFVGSILLYSLGYFIRSVKV